MFLFSKLPLAFFAGLRMDHFDQQSCIVSIPFNWITKNPFKSMYFAAQSMAAEFSTALLAVQAIEKSERNIALIIVELKAEFFKKAAGRVKFTCRDGQKFIDGIEKCIESGEPVTVEGRTEGIDEGGEKVSEFGFTWSFKLRS